MILINIEMMVKKLNIKGEKIILRAIELEDLPFLKQMINDPDNELLVVGWSIPVSTKMQEEWFLNINSEINLIRFSIQYEESFVGTCIINDINWKDRNGRINIKILDNYKSRGIGKDTINCIIKYFFETLNMNRIEANILQYNKASIHLFEKMGFFKEGIQRAKVFKNNKYNNLLQYSLLKEDYEKRKN